MRRLLALVGAATLLASGCSVDGDQAASAGDRPGGSVTVFAAASLTEAFTRLRPHFEAAHPGIRVTLNLAGSSTLARQINDGAPADVFASAAPEPMRTVTDAGNAAHPVTFVRNQLVIAVPEGNPRRVAGLADLTAPGLTLALCAEQVPCGAAARTALALAGVAVTPVTLELDVKAVLAKLRLGEVDAALVYRTDVRGLDTWMDGIEFPESARTVNDYQIAVLTEAPNPVGARAFVAYLRSDAGRAKLAESGFEVT